MRENGRSRNSSGSHLASDSTEGEVPRDQHFRHNMETRCAKLEMSKVNFGRFSDATHPGRYDDMEKDLQADMEMKEKQHT